jgi:hypothetical protein
VVPLSLDIPAEVALRRAAPAPILTAGTTVLGPGEYYLGSDLAYTGDLVLEDGATLFVEGSLDLNGALRGSGTLQVSGTTRLRGDTSLSSQSRVALLSHGDVTLEGYSGTDYLKTIPGATQILADIATTQSAMLDYLSQSADAGVMGGMGIVDRLNHQMGVTGTFPTFDAAIGCDRLGALLALVSTQADSETRTFLVDKLTAYKAFHDHNGSLTFAQKLAIAQDFANDPRFMPMAVEQVTDCFASLTGPEQKRAVAGLRSILSEFTYDRLGNSYFQGLVYTKGDFTATNQVTIIGALITDGGSNKGAVRLLGGTSLTYVRDFFDGDGGVSTGSGVHVVTWASR